MTFNTTQQLSNESTFSELSRWYLTSIAPRKLKEHTAYNHHLLMKNYVIPYIGDIPLREITPVLVDELLTYLAGYGAIRKEGNLSDATVQQIRIALSSVLQTAVRKEILERNPVTLSTKIRYKKKERSFLDEGSCRKVLFLCDSLTNQQIANAIRLLLFTGMRRGELIGLQWGDVDFSKNELYIRRTISQFDGRYVVTAPKTASSIRTISLCASAVKLLKEQMRITPGDADFISKDMNSPVFSNRNGSYMSGAYLNNCFRRMMAEAGMPGYHLHDLRHANASILINNGVPMKIVSSHLGHSSSAVTEVFYTHLFQNSLQITADVIEKRMTQDTLTK